MSWTPSEVWQSIRIQVAMALGVVPAEVDRMSLEDIKWVLAIHEIQQGAGRQNGTSRKSKGKAWLPR